VLVGCEERIDLVAQLGPIAAGIVEIRGALGAFELDSTVEGLLQ